MEETLNRTHPRLQETETATLQALSQRGSGVSVTVYFILNIVQAPSEHYFIVPASRSDNINFSSILGLPFFSLPGAYMARKEKTT